MPELIAQGSEPHMRWRKRIPYGESFVIGRASGDWSVPWDNHVSRNHVIVQWNHDRLHVERLEKAKNPVFYQGSPVESFDLRAGSHFVIGATLFTLVDDDISVDSEASLPMSEQTYSSAFLRKLQYRDSSRRVEVLGRLPEVIAQASDDEQLFKRVVSVLMSGIPEAASVAIVEMESESPEIRVRVMHWEGRKKSNSAFTPSRRLVQRALDCDDSVLHVCEIDSAQPVGAFTMIEDTLWAFATPIRKVAPEGKNWCIYVAGKPGLPSLVGEPSVDKVAVQEDMKFTELAASTVVNLIRLRRLERSQTSLRQFFSPIVLQAFAGADPDEVLMPRLTNVSVLFCDLRGFSRTSEQFSHDLMGLLDRVSRVLGLTTHEILQHGGVVGDFHGDAAMGFWGWPIASEDFVLRSCEAALAIRRATDSVRTDELLADFQFGMGIATGTAVAGKIGTEDQVKVTVFGPVANLASRLEGMTRQFCAPILVDEETANYIRQSISPDVARVRKIAKVFPYGMDNPALIHELLPPEGQPSAMSANDIGQFESAVDAFLAGDWRQANQTFDQLGTADPVSEFLCDFITNRKEVPPDDWDGAIHLASK